jgi:hypothetical protein
MGDWGRWLLGNIDDGLASDEVDGQGLIAIVLDVFSVVLIASV